MTALTDLTIAGALDGLAKKQFSSTELTHGAREGDGGRAHPQRLHHGDAGQGAAHGRAASDARRAKGEAGALEGIPLAIKDLFCTEGVQTTAGSHILDGFKPPYESTVTANLWRRAR